MQPSLLKLVATGFGYRVELLHLVQLAKGLSAAKTVGRRQGLSSTDG